MNKLFGLYLGYSVVELDGVIKIGTGPGYLKTPHFYNSEQAFDWLKSQIATNKLKPNMVKEMVDAQYKKKLNKERLVSVVLLLLSLVSVFGLSAVYR